MLGNLARRVLFGMQQNPFMISNIDLPLDLSLEIFRLDLWLGILRCALLLGTFL